METTAERVVRVFTPLYKAIEGEDAEIETGDVAYLSQIMADRMTMALGTGASPDEVNADAIAYCRKSGLDITLLVLLMAEAEGFVDGFEKAMEAGRKEKGVFT